jgi:hypothetical protein
MKRGTTIPELEEMLTYCRPHGSQTEADFVERYIAPLPGMGWDKYGNGILCIGSAPILWSAHTDTVHARDGRQAVQRLGHELRLAKKRNGLCLGADDGAGVWLLMEMIRANVSGLYIFHAGEEHGGLGSAWIAKNRSDLLRGYKAAIAFDRKGTTSVITHQGSRTCSDRFAMSLSRELGGGFNCDPTGTFTDTANYEGIIGECTNVSVGYEKNHGPNETLDLLHVRELRDMLVRFNHAGLVYEREPGEEDYDTWGPIKDASYEGFQEYAHSRVGLYDEAIIQMVYDYPECAARLIEQLGGNASDKLEQIQRDGHRLPDDANDPNR